MPNLTTLPQVSMTRRITFSSGHRYWIPNLNEAENRALFGKWANPYNHGHNYVLFVTVTGHVDPANGMIVNIKRVDDVLKTLIVSAFDGKSINDEIAYFQDHSSSLENLLLYLRDVLLEDSAESLSQLPQIRLTHLRLEEFPLLYADLDIPTNTMTLTRVYEFAASHRLHIPDLSLEENLQLFGKCNNAAGHGHNYVLEVTVEGTPSDRTGMMVDLEALDGKVKELILDRYDHKNLSYDLPEFEGKNSTSEVVVLQIFETLKGQLPAKLHRVRLHETARNIFEVTA